MAKVTHKKSMKLVPMVLIAVTMLVMAGTGFLLYRSLTSKPVSEEILMKYPVKGIDVSRHNGIINWKLVKMQGYSFAYIKATESVAYVDATFLQNYEAALQEHMLVGAYHFFRFDESGEKQARNFITNSRYQKGDLPPVIDVEHSTYNKPMNPAIVSANLKDLIHRLYVYYGVQPIVYTNKECYRKYVRDFITSEYLWIADLNNDPTLMTSNWTFWQHSHRGELQGISEKVDLNVFNGNYTQLLELVK